MAARRTGLGRGLESLIPDRSGEQRTSASAVKAEEAEAKKSSTAVKKTSTSAKKAANTAKKPSGAAKKAADAAKPDAKAGSDEKRNENVSEAPSGRPFMVKISLIEPNREQPRKVFDKKALEELAGSIKTYGIIQPLLVQPKGRFYEIVAGERRFRAAKLAGLTEVPVVIGSFDKQKKTEIALIENLQREDLNPMEEARAMDELIREYKMTQKELAERLSRDRATIANMLRLLQLDPEVQKMVEEGSLSMGHARALAGEKDPERQKELAAQVVSRGLSVRETEKLVKAPVKKTPAKPAFAESEAYIYRDMEERLKAAVGSQVRVTRKSKNKGKIEIEYYSMDELERIYQLILSAN